MPQPTKTSSTASGHHSTYSRSAIHPPRPSFNEETENFHRVEFEAPFSGEADSEENRLQKAQQGRFSIDYSLELERELAMESPPDTPAHHETAHPSTASIHSMHSRTESRTKDDVSPDPDVLAHIVTQLRLSLADMTKERDELVKMLAKASTEEANAKDALQVMTDKATTADEELTELRRKTKEDEDQIVLLRTKVEESRRGLMRLQTENRRQSMAPIDVARASPGNFTSFTSPPSSKRASFVPLTGSMQGKSPGHRRNGSVNDIGLGAFPTPDQSPSPNMRAFNIASAEASLSGAPSSSRRFSGLFGRAPSPLDGEVLPGTAAEPSANTLELEVLRKELQTIKDQLDAAKHELVEANEAKEASETCVIALRDFIAENNVGINGPSTSVKLPPPPSMTTGEESSTESKKSGWGFKLWGNAAGDPAVKSGIGNAPHSAAPVASSPMVGFAQTSPPSATIPAAPISRKIGGFFGSRSSISSNASREQHLPPALNLQTNAAATQLPSQRDSMYSHSDVSSIAEPISPGSDINGLGTATYQPKSQAAHQEEVLVKDLNSSEGASVRVSMSGSDMELR
ncbi:hypothetical protein BDN70DRAFT_880166 [Pholiota conissans]|uniref:Uncharacterized protein n=1 Tax=Pholiota conissans TaxID=109636 RepID=A0A9P5Z064_9AGAR|nr:hypothetical protein BDN70DRAFT_880166 [Pholiota conissans]